MTNREPVSIAEDAPDFSPPRLIAVNHRFAAGPEDIQSPSHTAAQRL